MTEADLAFSRELPALLPTQQHSLGQENSHGVQKEIWLDRLQTPHSAFALWLVVVFSPR